MESVISASGSLTIELANIKCHVHAQVTLVTKLVWCVAVHELELQSDIAGDSTISTLDKYVLAS